MIVPCSSSQPKKRHEAEPIPEVEDDGTNESEEPTRNRVDEGSEEDE